MDRFEFYKEWYYKEIDRRNTLEASLGLPIIVISAIISGTFFLVRDFHYKIDDFLSGWFIFLIVLSAVSTLVGIFWLAWFFAVGGFKYAVLPNPVDISNYHKKLLSYYGKKNRDKADEEFRNGLEDTFINVIKYNQNTNNKKSGFIAWARMFVVISLFFIILALIPYGINYYNRDEIVHNIKIVNEE